MQNVKWLFVVGLIAALPAGAMAMPNMVPPADKGSQEEMAPAKPPLVGKVLETMDGGGYTYILLGTKDDKKWVAVPEMYIKVGDQIELDAGVQMGSFTSKQLGKTFDNIIFSGGPTAKFNDQRMKDAHSGSGVVTTETKKEGEPKKEGKAVDGLKVEKATGANAYTVAEIYGKKESLNDKVISVRGQVVKASTSIMDRNWIHLQDGSGTIVKRNNNLVVTTKDKAAVGDIVTATGTFHANKDFGAGYKYDAILEDAKLSK